jgi:cytochrome b6-f complex iron-sulfur subunit
MTRRDLLQKVLIGGVIFLVLPPALNSCSKAEDPGNGGPPPPGNKLTLDLTNPTYAALNTIGGFVVTQGIIVANTSAGYVALDSTCTHMGCTIGYSSTANNFPCPCHGSIYSVTGSVLNGPTTVALKSYAVSKSGNTLTISL